MKTQTKPKEGANQSKDLSYKLWIVVFIFSFLFNFCSNPKSGNELQQHTDTPINQIRKRELLSSIHGGWVRKDYINKLITEQSPFKAFNKDFHFVELIIDTNRTLNGDTIGNPGCLENDTEMNYFKIILKNSKDSIKMIPWFVEGELREKEFLLDCKVNNKDTTLILIVNHEDSINQKIEYVKVYTNPPNKNYQINPLDYFIMKNFFEGKYNLYDSKNNLIEDSVNFSNFEKVNFLQYQLYAVAKEFEFGMPLFDYLTFYKDDKNESLHWRMSQGKIQLFSVKSSGNYKNGISRNIAKLKYQLVRLNK